MRLSKITAAQPLLLAAHHADAQQISCTARSVNDRKTSGLVQVAGERTVDSSGTRRKVSIL